MSIPISTKLDLMQALEKEGERFKETYLWLEEAMPSAFFQEVENENIMLITHSLMGFALQDYFSTIHLKNGVIVMCQDSDEADLRILEKYELYGIKHYQAYLSKTVPSFASRNLRIATIYFTEAIEKIKDPYSEEDTAKLKALVNKRLPEISDEEFNRLMKEINHRFLRAMPLDRLIVALNMLSRAKERDQCQYEVHYNEDWQQKSRPSLQIVLAWKNTPKHHFLYRLALTIHRHNLVIKKVNGSYIDPYSSHSILLLSLELHGSGEQAAWDAASIPEFLRELATVKYFACFDLINKVLVGPGLISRLDGNILRSMVNFVHQALAQVDIHQYYLEKIEEDLCRHPELTLLIVEAFRAKFDPSEVDIDRYEMKKEQFLQDLKRLDTGNEENDKRRKNVLGQAMNFVDFCLKTNAYRLNYSALAFRLDPAFLDCIPFNRKERFPLLPFAIFFIKGMHFFGFHIRFKDLSRGGLRTVFPDEREQMEVERNAVLAECYQLAYTQHKKNKDIPEGGSKGILFLKPYERLNSESLILEKELIEAGFSKEEVAEKIDSFRLEQKLEFLYQSQRAYIDSLITLVNCKPCGKLLAKQIVDYWRRPEYIYLGPDENMHDSMIQWIASYSKHRGYKPGSSFISGKPGLGINHKLYGVTSHGVHVYLIEVLKHLGINPEKEHFTVKMSGGPDGDVAGNQIKNLRRDFPQTAKLIALTDISGTIYDPEGLDLNVLCTMFEKIQPIRYYPAKKLHEGGFLLDRYASRSETAYTKKNLRLRKEGQHVLEEWISANEMHHVYRYNVHMTPADIFIPAGGRPRALNRYNIDEFLDKSGKPSAKAIIEGANLYISSSARTLLEDKGVLIVKDSSANKTGVICSSFEVLAGLALTEEEFFKEKEALVEEILTTIQICAQNEATLLFQAHKNIALPLTVISDLISEKINTFTDQILDNLSQQELPQSTNASLIKAYLDYCLPLLTKRYQKSLMSEIPDIHKKSIIASYLAAKLVYTKGLAWQPTVVDILPVLLKETLIKPITAYS